MVTLKTRRASTPPSRSFSAEGADDPRSEFGCDGWYERLNMKTIPPSLPCGGDDPEHYQNFHPEIAIVYRELHAGWAQQIEACERLWSGESAPGQ